jgi:hypothetical protein
MLSLRGQIVSLQWYLNRKKTVLGNNFQINIFFCGSCKSILTGLSDEIQSCDPSHKFHPCSTLLVNALDHSIVFSGNHGEAI